MIENDEQTDIYDDSNEGESLFHYFQSLFSFPLRAPYTYLCNYIQNSLKVLTFFQLSLLAELRRLSVQMGNV